MAFYATDRFEHAVGPGIGRAEYGGLLLTLPSQRMRDVWTDLDYAFAETKPERLLMAALDYSLERFVVYVTSPPTPIDFPFDRRTARPKNHLRPAWSALPRRFEEDSRDARTR